MFFYHQSIIIQQKSTYFQPTNAKIWTLEPIFGLNKNDKISSNKMHKIEPKTKTNWWTYLKIEEAMIWEQEEKIWVGFEWKIEEKRKGVGLV